MKAKSMTPNEVGAAMALIGKSRETVPAEFLAGYDAKQTAMAAERERLTAEMAEYNRLAAAGMAEDKFAKYYEFMSAGADTEFCQFWRETSMPTLTLLEDGRYLERMTTMQAAAFFAAGQPHVIYVRTEDGPLIEVLQGEMIFPDTQPMRFSRCRIGAVIE